MHRVHRFHRFVARSMPYVVGLGERPLERNALREFWILGMYLLWRGNMSPKFIIQKEIHVDVAGISDGYIGAWVVGRLSHVGGACGFEAMRFSFWRLSVTSLGIRIHNAHSLHLRRYNCQTELNR